jgi:glycine oxidase
MAALPWPAELGRAIVYHKDCYLLARGEEAILGSTMEFVGFHPEVTSDGIARIFAATLALSPGLVRGKVKRTWAGLRPVTPDWLPIVGAEPRVPGLWYATGHGRNGILLAGITGVMIREMLDGKPVKEAASWSPTRF